MRPQHGWQNALPEGDELVHLSHVVRAEPAGQGEEPGTTVSLENTGP
jgi:hypothetical protein